jgi:hypothetical protein
MKESKMLKSALKPSLKLKKRYFEELIKLSKKYGVLIYGGEVEWRSHDEIEMIPAIYFDFYDGSTYIWSDGILGDTAVSKFDSFDNSGNITIQGI